MNRSRYAMVGVVGLLLLIVSFLWICRVALSVQARDAEVSGAMYHLATCVEIYRDQVGDYPMRIEELTNSAIMLDEAISVAAQQIAYMRSNRWGDRYHYEQNGEEFAISVHPKSGSRYEKIERHYRVGEVWQDQ